jgi:hypothetical protein
VGVGWGKDLHLSGRSQMGFHVNPVAGEEVDEKTGIKHRIYEDGAQAEVEDI